MTIHFPSNIKLSLHVAFIIVLMLVSYYSVASSPERIAVITNIKNTSTQITHAEAVNIFMGRFREFSDGSKAKPIDNVSIENNFYIQLVAKSPAEIKAYWARLIFSGRTHPPTKGGDTDKVIDLVKREQQAITYVPFSQVDNSVKVLLLLKEKE